MQIARDHGPNRIAGLSPVDQVAQKLLRHWILLRLRDGRQFFRRVLLVGDGWKLVSGDSSLESIEVTPDEVDTIAKPVALWVDV